MKIDFNASYRELESVVNASARSDSVYNGAELSFGKMLSSISPEPKEIRENTKALALNLQKNEGEFNTEEVMASYSLPEPQQISPVLEPIIIEDIKDDNEVKNMTILEVKRIHNVKQISKLPKSERLKNVRGLIESAGKTQGVDPVLGISVAEVESAFNPLAVSSDGHNSKGLFQLLDSTGMDMKKRLAVSESYDPFNPEQNVKFGIAYLKYLHEIFSTKTPLATGLETVPAANSASLEKLAVAAYNAGEGRVAAAQKRATRAGYDPAEYAQVEAYLPESTRKYVVKVIASKGNYANIFQG